MYRLSVQVRAPRAPALRILALLALLARAIPVLTIPVLAIPMLLAAGAAAPAWGQDRPASREAGLICPDRTAPSIRLFDRRRLNREMCSLQPGDLLYNLVHGLHADAKQAAVTDTAVVFLGFGQGSGDDFLAPYVVGRRRCFITDALPLPAYLGGTPDALTERQTIGLGALFQSDCQPVPGRWQYRVGHYPALAHVVAVVLGEFALIAKELYTLERERYRLAGIFGDQPRPETAEGVVLRPINRPLQLSRLALDLADAAKPFVATMETMLKPSEDQAGAGRAQRWVNTVAAAFPTDQELKSLELDDRVALLSAFLATPALLAHR
ncbi:MAG: hypothetical protein GC168_18770 [Candidatus Hydrogenedens sp.]|nr:hypothetical protein [Candidatus Hydrogenedens sp.]